MAESKSMPCPKCGALNDVLIPADDFEEQMRYAAFSFACRLCGEALPTKPERAPAEPSQKR
jgi:hypothetical protein